MINAAEQMFSRDGEYTSLIWLDYILHGEPRPLIFLIHDHGWWKGFPDLCTAQVVRFPHPGTVGGFAYLIEKASLSLGTAMWPERSFQTDVSDDPWEFKDSYGRLLRLELPGMNWHVEY